MAKLSDTKYNQLQLKLKLNSISMTLMIVDVSVDKSHPTDDQKTLYEEAKIKVLDSMDLIHQHMEQDFEEQEKIAYAKKCFALSENLQKHIEELMVVVDKIIES